MRGAQHGVGAACIFYPIGIVGFAGAAMSLPVEILGRLQPATGEALVVSLEQRAESRIRVELVLAEGGRAHASLDSLGLAWLGLRAGDIVWVRPLTG
jgi:hypothetical protein